MATEYASADEHWAPYAAVNEAFARRVVEVYQPGQSSRVLTASLGLTCLCRRFDLDTRLSPAFSSFAPQADPARCCCRPIRTHSLPKLRSLPLPAQAKGDPRWHARRKLDLFPDVLVQPPLHVVVCAGLWIREYEPWRHRCARTCGEHRLLPCRCRCRPRR